MHAQAKIIPLITDTSLPNPISHHSVPLSDSQREWDREYAIKKEQVGGEKQQDPTELETPLVNNHHTHYMEFGSL